MPEDDLVHAHFTVEETLAYTAELRMDATLNGPDRKERIEYVVTIMGIDHCRNTIVGDTRRKGISGGERKRLCVAMELLTKPSLLFLDEPTSGKCFTLHQPMAHNKLQRQHTTKCFYRLSLSLSLSLRFGLFNCAVPGFHIKRYDNRR